MSDSKPVDTVVDELAKARTPAELASAHRAARRAVLAARRASKLGPLAQTYTAAMEIWDAEKADGVSLDERLAHLEKTLRVAWPQSREWHYLCASCRDIGLEMLTCSGDASCGRQNAHLPHDYGKPCWCAKGAKFRERPKPTKEDFKAAGKTKMTKVGR